MVKTSYGARQLDENNKPRLFAGSLFPSDLLLSILLLLFSTIAGCDPWSTYQECSENSPCGSSFECKYGLCVPICPGAPADGATRSCTEGLVCWQDGCRAECDDAHPCTQAFSCENGQCVSKPCEHPSFWPKSVSSKLYPYTIHYRDDSEIAEIERIAKAMDRSWQVETRDLGFRGPMNDQGSCGKDGNFDVFVWRTFRASGADIISDVKETSWDDYSTYLVLDPWGPYGGSKLPALVAHELNHAMQAAYDWWETPIFFEMTSQFIEDLVYDSDNGYKDFLFDFQKHPDWAFDYNDNYETWYMYGSSLYLFYLRDGVFGGDATFISKIWDRCRNSPGENEPDFEDALDSLLTETAGITFYDSLIEFARWRYFTSSRDDRKHFREGATFPEDSLVAIEKRLRIGNISLSPPLGPMMLGTQYIQLYRENSDPDEIEIRFEGDSKVRWVIQAIPSLSNNDIGKTDNTVVADGEIFDLSSGKATLRFGELLERALVVTALPLGPDDPDGRNDARFDYKISIITQ